MLTKVEVALPQLVASPSISPERAAWITAQTNLFFGSFRKADADNPEVFTIGCARLFGDYPPDVVAYVVDPLTGLPGKSEWLPSLRAVKVALDERHAELARLERFQEAERKQLADRQAHDADRQHRPTLEQLQSKHGENWGIGPTDDRALRARELALALIANANDRLRAAEYRAAGMAPLEAAPGLTISIELTRSLRDRSGNLANGSIRP